MAGHGDQGFAKPPGHVFNKPGLAAAGGAFQHHREPCLPGCSEHPDFIPGFNIKRFGFNMHGLYPALFQDCFLPNAAFFPSYNAFYILHSLLFPVFSTLGIVPTLERGNNFTLECGNDFNIQAWNLLKNNGNLFIKICCNK